MSPDTTLVLGEVTFAGAEIPSRIPFGGEQRLSVKQLVGGTRVIDAMGRSDRPVEWSGLFLHKGAVARAQALDAMRISGAQQSLSWSGFRYLVVVRSFEADFERPYQIPYHIVCEVVADQTQPTTATSAPSADDAISDDESTAAGLVSSVNDPTLTAHMTAISAAVATVATFSQAPPSVIQTVLPPIAAAQLTVAALITANDSTLDEVDTFGGVQSGDASASVAALEAQIASANTLSALYELQGVLGRMASNISSASSSQSVVTLAGGNLFFLAEQYYDDATAWTVIARANGLTDPFIQGAESLTIPPQSDNSGGVLGA